MFAGELAEALQVAAMTQLMEGNGVQPAVREIVAECFGVHVLDWALNREYLQELNKSEIIHIGEEPGMKIWSDEKVQEYRDQHHKGKALHSLSKEALIDIILKSGAELAGRVPAEILGTRKG